VFACGNWSIRATRRRNRLGMRFQGIRCHTPHAQIGLVRASCLVFVGVYKLMKENPPAAVDAPQLAKFARIGIVPGQDFDATKLKADFVKRVPEVGFDRIMLQFERITPYLRGGFSVGHFSSTVLFAMMVHSNSHAPAKKRTTSKTAGISFHDSINVSRKV
jgi:hypothetical protein